MPQTGKSRVRHQQPGAELNLEHQESCSYCKQQGADFLIKCVEKSCQRWFCNGCKNTKEGGYQKESHIITHLRISNHRQIAVFDTRAIPVTNGGNTSNQPLYELFCFRCIICHDDNVFDLGMDTVNDGRNSRKHLCRHDGIKMKKFSTEGLWVPFVNCHHPTLKCIDENIVKVPSKNDQKNCTEMSRKAIIALERSWLLAAHGILLPEEGNVTMNTIRETFTTLPDYKEHFTQLVELERLLESAQFAAIPILENVAVIDLDIKSPVRWFAFKTKSQLHIKALHKGQLVSVLLQAQNIETRYQANVDSYQLSNGFMVIWLVFVERNLRSSDLKGTISIEVIYQDIVHKRWLEAISRFGESGVAAKGSRSTSIILGLSAGNQSAGSNLYGQRSLVTVPGRNLNPSQKQAIYMAMASPLSLIQGPPGTGKTHTIVALVHNILPYQKNESIGVLCCAPSNDPIDHLAVQLSQSGLDVLRINSRKRQTKSLPESIWQLTLQHKLEQVLGKKYKRNRRQEIIEQTTDQIIESSQVICTTCNTAAHYALKKWSFATVIVDEATQATETDALIPITKGCERVVLIGDEKQLGVFSKFRELEKSNLNWSMFERLIKLGQAPHVMLDTQYRMHPSICLPPATVVYGGLLGTGPNVASLRQSSLLNFIHPTPQNSAQILMIHTTKLHGVASDGVSFVNEREAIVVALCLVNLLHRNVKPEAIGVITFYNGQKIHLKQIIEEHTCIPKSFQEKLMVDSVDGFQGREKDYIILSCVRSGQAKSTTVGFLADQRRLNVALTRAKKGIIIVGNRSLLEESDDWKAILAFYPTIQLEPALLALGVNNTRQLNCLYCHSPNRRMV